MFKRTILISTVVSLLSVTAMARGHHGNGDYNRGYGNNDYRGEHNLTYGNEYYRGDHNRSYGNSSFSHSSYIDISSIPLSDLTDIQKDGLSFMIEEEKVARDVYSYLYNLWGSRVFGNISNAEQRHIDAIEALLNRYTLETPSTLDTKGKFENAELQGLYDTLIEKGTLSLIDALEVGVMVEETDIADLEDILKAGVPTDFEITYQNLLKGSYNHLNAFNRQLARQ